MIYDELLREPLRKAEYVIYDRFVDAFSEPPTEPPIPLAQINRLSNGGFFVPGKRDPANVAGHERDLCPFYPTVPRCVSMRAKTRFILRFLCHVASKPRYA